MEVNSELMSQLESLTIKGDTKQVTLIIDGLVFKKIPRPFAPKLAQICFRNSLYLQSIKILNPIILPKTPINPAPQPAEIIAYANALVSLNMHREARTLLKKIDKQKSPDALLIESFSYFGDWNYNKTIPLLKQFSSNSRVSYYRQIVGKVNLAAAYITSANPKEASKTLSELLKVTREQNYRLLQGNTLELFAQLEIQNKNYEKALSYLDQAKAIFPDTSSIYFFFVKKWECICRMLLSPNNPELIKKCEDLKSEALKWRHWETARDIDLYIAYATKNTELLQKIIVGTANPNYFKKVQHLFGYKINPLKYFKLKKCNDNDQNLISINYIDILNKIKKNKYQQKLFSILARDFYRPANLGSIFSELHPNEHFNPVTSEKRILNQIYALKEALNSFGDFFNLRKDKMDFIFELNTNTELIFLNKGHRIHYKPTFKEQLRSFGPNPFTSTQLAKNLNCSQRKAQVIIKQLLNESFLLPLNSGTQKKYVISSYQRNHSKKIAA